MAGQRHDASALSDPEVRVGVLESILTEKGYVDPAALDALIQAYEVDVGPRNGARVVARAWSDPDYRARLMADATPAIAELGYAGRQGEHMVAVENTRGSLRKSSMIHNGATPNLSIDPETYAVVADGVLLTCAPADLLPMAQRYFLF